jgi:hypothetical protein
VACYRVTFTFTKKMGKSRLKRVGLEKKSDNVIMPVHAMCVDSCALVLRDSLLRNKEARL